MIKPLALIIEDEEDLSLIFARAFQVAGYETEVCRDGQQALNFLKQHIPYIVLLDLHLPNISGPEILTKIRAYEGTKNTYVIIASADARLALDAPVENQASFVFHKPVRFSHIRDLAQRLHPNNNSNLPKDGLVD